MTKEIPNKPSINHEDKKEGQIANNNAGGNDDSATTKFAVPGLPDGDEKNQQNNQQQQNSQQQGYREYSYQQNYQPNYQAPPGYAAYNPYPKKSGTWWKVLLIIAGVLLVLGFIGYQITSFFDSFLYYSDEPEYDIPEGEYIARIAVEGEITSDGGDYLSESIYDHQFTLEILDEITEDDNNKGLLLYVDTPGGGVYESDELYRKILKYKEETKRPVYVAMGSMAASGGYYISAPADKIVADRNTWTGSIGVTMGTVYDITGFLNKHGIKAENLTAGRNKAMGSIVEPMTDEQRKIFQSLLNDSYNQFVGIIAEGRDMDIKTVKTLADGRIYTATQAKANGLIDDIATLEEAELMIQKENDLEDCDVEPIEYYYEDEFWGEEFIKAYIKPALERLQSLGKGDLETALELTEKNDKMPLKYLYEQ